MGSEMCIRDSSWRECLHTILVLLPLYFAFIDLEKAFDRVPREVIWWAMRKLGLEEWIINIVKAMYNNATSKVRINGS